MSFDDRDYYREKHNAFGLPEDFKEHKARELQKRFAEATGDKQRLREIGRYPRSLPSNMSKIEEILLVYPWVSGILIVVIIGFVFATALIFTSSQKATPSTMSLSGYTSKLEMNGKKIILRRGVNGHFFLPVSVNGQESVFMVDTGASSMAINTGMAQAAKVQIVGNIQSRTANGIAHGWTGVAHTVSIGPYNFQGVQVGILPNLVSEPLLGMNVLQNFEIILSGEHMILNPKH